MSKNDITGDEIKTGAVTEAYRSGWDRIFGPKIDSDQTDHGNSIECGHQGSERGFHARTISGTEDCCGFSSDERSAESGDHGG